MKPLFLPGSSRVSKLRVDGSHNLKPTLFLSANHHRAYMPQAGRAEPHGLVADDEAYGTICVSLCEGVSSAGAPAPAAGLAQQTLCRDGRRSAFATGLL